MQFHVYEAPLDVTAGAAQATAGAAEATGGAAEGSLSFAR